MTSRSSFSLSFSFSLASFSCFIFFILFFFFTSSLLSKSCSTVSFLLRTLVTWKTFSSWEQNPPVRAVAQACQLLRLRGTDLGLLTWLPSWEHRCTASALMPSLATEVIWHPAGSVYRSCGAFSPSVRGILFVRTFASVGYIEKSELGVISSCFFFLVAFPLFWSRFSCRTCSRLSMHTLLAAKVVSSVDGGVVLDFGFARGWIFLVSRAVSSSPWFSTVKMSSSRVCIWKVRLRCNFGVPVSVRPLWEFSWQTWWLPWAKLMYGKEKALVVLASIVRSSAQWSAIPSLLVRCLSGCYWHFSCYLRFTFVLQSIGRHGLFCLSAKRENHVFLYVHLIMTMSFSSVKNWILFSLFFLLSDDSQYNICWTSHSNLAVIYCECEPDRIFAVLFFHRYLGKQSFVTISSKRQAENQKRKAEPRRHVHANLFQSIRSDYVMSLDV